MEQLKPGDRVRVNNRYPIGDDDAELSDLLVRGAIGVVETVEEGAIWPVLVRGVDGASMFDPAELDLLERTFVVAANGETEIA